MVCFCCNYSWRSTFGWKTCPFLPSLFLVLFFVVTSPGNAFLYGGPIRFCHHHFSFYFCCDLSSKCTFVWRTSPFSSSLFFVLFSLWQLLENALLTVFVIAIFCFLFVVATPGDALSYGESPSFPHSCFLWLLQEMRFCIEDLAVFSLLFFFLWLLLEMHFWLEDLSVFVIAILFCVFAVNPPGNAFCYGGLSIFFVLFCFWRDFSWKCSIVWRTSPFSL